MLQLGIISSLDDLPYVRNFKMSLQLMNIHSQMNGCEKWKSFLFIYSKYRKHTAYCDIMITAPNSVSSIHIWIRRS